MKRTIQVYLGDDARRVGTLHFDAVGSRQHSAFAYKDSWLKAADRFALDPGLPLVAGPQYHRKTRDGSVIHAAFADTEPDGWAKRVILRDHAKRRQEARRAGEEPVTTQLNALDFLFAVDDSSRVGALRFKDEQGVFCHAFEAGRRTAPPLVELGLLLAATRAVETENETAADLAYLRGRGTSLGGMRPKCTVVDDDGRLSIGKFPSVTDEHPVTKGEVLAMTLAKAAGIHAAEARLVESDGFLHANHGQWSLAPAFDINPFPERMRELKTWVSEETGPEATIEALLSVIAYFRIPLVRAKEILGETERAISGWRDQGQALGMTHRELEQFAAAFEHPERHAARQAMR